jgi:hypothetical protein
LRWGLTNVFAWNCNLRDLSLPHSWGWQACTVPNYWLKWGLAVYLGWPQGVILPISASQVAGLQVWATGISCLYVLFS